MLPLFLTVLVPAAAVATAADITPSTFALAASFPHHQLFVADDDHMLASMSSDGSRKALVQAFLRYGPGSPEFEAALTRAAPHRWVEK